MTTRLMPALTNLSADAAQANGRLGVLTTPRGPLVLQALALEAQIDDLVAGVEVRQTFHNPYDAPVEATYIFPLPDRAAVTRFRMKVNDRVIDGVLQERAAARAQYEQAIRQGYSAAITEEERSNVFSIRVGNLLPCESAEIELTLVQPLGFDQGEATFQFPLVVAPRYIPGDPLPGESVGLGTSPDTDAVPDATRISPPVLLPGYPYPVRLSGRLRLRQTRPDVGQVSLPMHQAGMDGAYEVWELQPGSRLDRDLILRFRLAQNIVSSELLISPDEPGASEGTFALTLVPPTSRSATVRPREILFVLDRSGSMEGWKLVAARRALGRMIDTLSPADRFKILAFDDRVEALPRDQSWYHGIDRQRFEALEVLARINARGGTEMAKPLADAVRLLGESRAQEMDKIMVLITDGQVGNEDQILKHLQAKLAGFRVFTLGVDQAVNEGFLRRLAALGGGTTEVVESEDRLDAVMTRIHRRIAAPVLRNLQLEGKGLALELDTVVPTRLPDLFPGAPLVLNGRCRLPFQGAVQITATDEAGQPSNQLVEARTSLAPALRWTWARSQLRALEDQYVCQPSPALEQRIVELSLKHGVLCRFTAFVAIDRSRVANAGGQNEQIVQPVEFPAGWQQGGLTRAYSAHFAAGAMPLTACLSPSPDASFDDDQEMCGSVDACRLDASVSFHSPPARSFKATPPTKGAALDLSAYRRRAEELADLVEATDAADALRTLGIVELRLQELLEDLDSIGASMDEVQSLVELAEWISPILQMADAAAATALIPQCLTRLRDFAKGRAVARPGKPSRKKWKFWA